MKAEIKRLHSPDIKDLPSYSPNSDEFSFLLQIMVSPKGEDGEDGEESFDLIVCTPKWMLNHYDRTTILYGMHFIILFEYNYSNMRRKIEEVIERLEADDWETLAEKIGKLGKWEFENYEE